MAPVFKTREYRPDGVFLATDPGSELPALLLQAQMRADPKFLLPPLPAMLSALADPDAPPLLRTLALLLETEERLPTITAQIRARVADTALEPQIADATAAIQLARFTTRPIPEICAMGGITMKDFSQSMAYRKIFGLGEQRGRELGLEQGLRKAWSKVSKPANSRSPCASYGAAAVPSPPRRRPGSALCRCCGWRCWRRRC